MSDRPAGELEKARRLAGLSARDLAQLTGTSSPNLTRIEAHGGNPSTELRKRLASILADRITAERLEEVLF